MTMATKLVKNTYPDGNSPDDFKCFGPPATKDDGFDGTMIADMGCFTQDGKDTCKYYHGAVVQSNLTSIWYTYFQWGRTGASKPSFQFVECANKTEAEAVYAKQLLSKNVKRGEWFNHPKLGQILRAKAGKDCYLVRAQATRSTGLPDAKTITHNEGAKQTVATPSDKKNSIGKKRKVSADAPTMSLMRDLSVGTVNYTRSSMADSALPTQAAIDEARDILAEAQKQVSSVGDDVDAQVQDKELQDLTSLMYGRIPKVKKRNAPPEDWILSTNNISGWYLDLDAYESSLYVADMGESTDDPFGGMRIKMRHLGRNDPAGGFVRDWMPSATRNRHSYLGGLQIKNVWEVEREGDAAKVTKAQNKIAKQRWRTTERPLRQPAGRPDLDRENAKLFARSNTALMFHGTRSVNVAGLLRESWRLPSNLKGVKITAWMFGPGCYWADDWKKSAGYTSLHNAYYAKGSGNVRGRGAFMFIADVVLGASYIAPRAKGFTKAPTGCHSVCGLRGHTQARYGALQNNEFITYDTDQCRARYLVEFNAPR